MLRQTAQALARSFGGQAAVLVARAQGSAAALCSLLCAHFPAFRDEAIYRGRQARDRRAPPSVSALSTHKDGPPPQIPEFIGSHLLSRRSSS